MKKLYYSVLVLLMGNTILQAQTTVNGTVKDSSGKPIAFAVLKVNSDKEKTISIEKIADENGNFQISIPESGQFVLNVSADKFATYSKAFSFTEPTQNVSIELYKEKTIDINEVVIKKSKPIIQRKIDRVVLNVSEHPSTAGKSSLDLFKMAPGVFVSSGKVSINGVWGTRVMVDGKMLNLSGDDLKNYLQNLRSNEIASIEIIAHPSAEFDAEGSGGIINIVLKKNTKQGLNGYIGTDNSFGLGKFPSYNPYASLNFKKGKLGLAASYSYTNSKNFEELTQQRDFPENGKYIQSVNDVQKNKSNRVKIGATYDISSKQFLGISYTGQFSKFKSASESYSQIIYPDVSKNIKSIGSFPTDSDTQYHNTGLNYSIKTDTLGSKFTFIADYTYNKRKGNSYSGSKNYDIYNNIVSDTLFRFHYPSEAKILTAEGKYSWNFKSGKNLAFGAKATSTQIDNTNSYEAFDSVWSSTPELDFNFDYREKVYAGFVNFSGNWGKTEYQLGARGEQTVVDASLYGSQQGEISQNYFSFFPSLFLKKNLNEEGSNYLGFSYNRRIKRPSYFDLNPYKYYIDNYSVTTGNPYLKPQYTNSFEISGLWSGKYYTALGYSYTEDVISQIIQNNGEELLTVIKANAGNSGVYTATLSAPLKIAKWWTTSNNLLLTYTISKSPYFKIEKPSFVLQTEQEIDLGKEYSMSLNAFYTPQMVSGNILTKSIASVDVGFQKKFLKNQFTAKVSFSDIFYTSPYKATSYFNNTEIKISHKEQSRMVSFSLIYTFKTGEDFKTKKIESSSTEEKSRL